MKALAAAALILAPVSTSAQNTFFSSSMEGRLGAIATVSLEVENTRANQIDAARATVSTYESAIAARNTCSSAGLVYLPASPSANAQGCVDPSVWGIGSWQLGAWSACSATCGGGNQTRSVVCLKNGNPAPDNQCPAPKPSTSQTCNTQACPMCGIAWASNANHTGNVPQATILWCYQSKDNFGGFQRQTCFWALPSGGGSAFYEMWGFRLYLDGTTLNGWNYKGVQNAPVYGAMNKYQCHQ